MPRAQPAATNPLTKRQPSTQRWWRLLLAAIAALVVGLLGAGTASAATVPDMQPRVGASTPTVANAVGVAQHIAAGQHQGNAPPGAEIVSATGVAAKSGIAANQLAGNAARDALAAAHPGSLIEQSFSTTAGVRRLDVLTQGGLGIESKVGRTSLTAASRSQIAKDSLLLGNGDVTGMEWVFSRSGVTGQMGPTGPLADALGKAGIPWSLAP